MLNNLFQMQYEASDSMSTDIAHCGVPPRQTAKLLVWTYHCWSQGVTTATVWKLSLCFEQFLETDQPHCKCCRGVHSKWKDILPPVWFRLEQPWMTHPCVTFAFFPLKLFTEITEIKALYWMHQIEVVKCNFCQFFCFMSNLNVDSAWYWPIVVFPGYR